MFYKIFVFLVDTYFTKKTEFISILIFNNLSAIYVSNFKSCDDEKGSVSSLNLLIYFKVLGTIICLYGSFVPLSIPLTMMDSIASKG